MSIAFAKVGSDTSRRGKKEKKAKAAADACVVLPFHFVFSVPERGNGNAWRPQPRKGAEVADAKSPRRHFSS
jgi:hypothetical protein